MAQSSRTASVQSTTLTAAEREWIRRQGITARVLAEERRRVRAVLMAQTERTAPANELQGRRHGPAA